MNRWIFSMLVILVVLEIEDSQADECQLKADVVFIVDSSRSIWEPHYELQLDFLANLTEQLNVGPKGTHVGALSFSEGARLDFFLTDFTDVGILQDKIRGIQFMQKGITETYAGLGLAREVLFKEANGARDDVPHIIIIVTDGNSRNRTATKLQADKAREEGIHVIAVGVGDSVDYSQLAEMATQNTTTYVYTVDNFSFLDDLGADLISATCQATTTPPPTSPMSTQPSPTAYEMTTDEMMSSDEAQKMCTSKQADVVFVLDKSSSIKTPHFKTQLNFVNNVIDVFNVGKNRTHVGVITFDIEPKVEFTLQDYHTKGQIRQAVSKIKYTAGSTNTHLALEAVARKMLTPGAGARKAVARVVVLVTDGQSSDPEKTEYWAHVLKKKFGADVFTIGVGTQFDREELATVASKPTKNHTFEVNDYNALNSIKDMLAIRACEVTSGDIFVRCQQNAVPSDVMFVTHFVNAGISDVKSSTELVKEVAAGFMTSEGLVRVGLTSSECVHVSDIRLGQAPTLQNFVGTVNIENEGGIQAALSKARLQVTSGERSRKRVMVVVVHGPISDMNKAKSQIMRAKHAKVHFVFVGRGRAIRAQLLQLSTLRKRSVDRMVMEGQGLARQGPLWQSVLAEVCEVLAPGQE